jgi:hypothetical protein
VSGALGTRLFRLWHADSVKYWQFLPTFLRNNRHSIPKKCKILQLRGEGRATKPRAFNKGRCGMRLAKKMAEQCGGVGPSTGSLFPKSARLSQACPRATNNFR